MSLRIALGLVLISVPFSAEARPAPGIVVDELKTDAPNESVKGLSAVLLEVVLWLIHSSILLEYPRFKGIGLAFTYLLTAINQQVSYHVIPYRSDHVMKTMVTSRAGCGGRVPPEDVERQWHRICSISR